MRSSIRFVVLSILVGVFFNSGQVNAAEGLTTDLINLKGDVIGSVKVQEAKNGLLIKIYARNLPPGKHAMHIHKVGNCDGYYAFEKSGGHINYFGKEHGLLNPNGPHDGDLPNLYVKYDGTVEVELYTNLLKLEGSRGNKASLLDRDGSALIIHAKKDDNKTEPTGKAGSRIACAVFHKKFR
jgi:superoxide dismutase, Cu-Zn family